MNKDQTQGKWTQMKGALKEQYGKLTDDDVQEIEGRTEKLAGKLQERYGMAKEEAAAKANEWFARQEAKGNM